MHIVQIVPELNEGGVERGTVELSRELVRQGCGSTVISAGGKLVPQIVIDGGRHVTLDVAGKNPLTATLSSVRKDTDQCLTHAFRQVLSKFSTNSGVSLRVCLRNCSGPSNR